MSILPDDEKEDGELPDEPDLPSKRGLVRVGGVVEASASPLCARSGVRFLLLLPELERRGVTAAGGGVVAGLVLLEGGVVAAAEADLGAAFLAGVDVDVDVDVDVTTLVGVFAFVVVAAFFLSRAARGLARVVDAMKSSSSSSLISSMKSRVLLLAVVSTMAAAGSLRLSWSFFKGADWSTSCPDALVVAAAADFLVCWRSVGLV